MVIQRKAIVTIGYGNRPSDVFVELLMQNCLEFVCDVRSTPISSRFPTFSRNELEGRLKQAGLRYLFMGDTLGARPKDPALYVNGRASYEAISASTAFREGIERVKRGCQRYRLALMCAEKEPLDCHRAILVARHLSASGLDVDHIDAQGNLESHADFESRLMRRYHLEQTNLLADASTAQVLNGAYERRGSELAFEAHMGSPSVAL